MSFKCLRYLYEVVRTNFSADFLDLSQFLTAISRQLWRHLATEMRTISFTWKCNDLRKKSWKLRNNRPINRDTAVAQTMSPSHEERSSLGAWQTEKKQWQTPYFRTYSRRALYDLPQTLHGDRDRRYHQKRWQSFFIQRIVFFLGYMHGKIRPNWPKHSFSAITP